MLVKCELNCQIDTNKNEFLLPTKCLKVLKYSYLVSINYDGEFYNKFVLIWHFTSISSNLTSISSNLSSISSNFTSLTSFYRHWDNAPTPDIPGGYSILYIYWKPPTPKDWQCFIINQPPSIMDLSSTSISSLSDLYSWFTRINYICTSH